MWLVSGYEYRWYETIALNIAKMGNVPRHISVTIDGNRRFAKKHNLTEKYGLMRAFEKMSDMAKWCLDLGVKEFTLNLLPICSYTRNSVEIDNTFAFCTKVFKNALKEQDSVKKDGIRVRVIGNLSMLPKDLQEVVAKVMLLTEKHDKLFLNLAIAYSSREEMANVIHEIIDESGNDLKPEDFKEDLVDQCLYTRGCSKPDLFIRTSGETSISDFIIWQLSGAVLFFPETLWPEISMLEFISGIFLYQRASLYLTDYKQCHQQNVIRATECRSDRVSDFLQKLDVRRRAHLVSLADGNVKVD